MEEIMEQEKPAKPKGKYYRAVQFRGKGSDGRWYYGELQYYEYSQRYAIYDNVADALQIVDAVTVGEYTGFEDSDGVPVYEGDYISVGRFILKVVWDKVRCGFRLINRDDSDSFYNFTAIRKHKSWVIGNIIEGVKR